MTRWIVVSDPDLGTLAALIEPDGKVSHVGATEYLEELDTEDLIAQSDAIELYDLQDPGAALGWKGLLASAALVTASLGLDAARKVLRRRR